MVIRFRRWWARAGIATLVFALMVLVVGPWGHLSVEEVVLSLTA